MPGVTRRLDINPDDEQPTEPAQPELPPQKELPAQLILRVVSTDETIHVPVKSAIIIGRKDPAQRIPLDLDLTPYRAYQCGVSRNHAIIVVREHELWVRALSSTNATQVNQRILTIGEEYPLSDGDELRLGALRLKVSFVTSPATSAT
jgi:pSer/pThr/pTyr-binding forkhead associated (FHA) protein